MGQVTLTFDNGPDPGATPEVLDCLERHRIRATFFVLGSKAITQDGGGLIRRASQAGHWIGNHTYSHTTPLGELGSNEAIDELQRTHAALGLLGIRERLFRPFGRAGTIGPHLLNPAALAWLQAHAYSCVLWNSIPGDWHDPQGWLDRAVADCETRDWSLVVLHDLPNGAMRHLDRFVRTMMSKKFRFVQEFPPQHVPIVDGEIVGTLAGMVGAGL